MRKNIFKWYCFPILFILLVGILVLNCPPQATRPFRFVFMTDIHVEPRGPSVDGFTHAIEYVNSLHPDFVITGGDLVADALAQAYPRADSLYRLYEEVTKKFTVAVYNTMGNHEVFGLYRGSGVDPSHPEYGKQLFKHRIGEGKTYRSFNHKGWHFMLLDGVGFTETRRYYGHVDSTEMAWIREDLDTLDARTPIVVCIHIPFYSIRAQIDHNPTTPNSENLVVTNANEVMKLFENRNLKMVVSGHLHWCEEIIFRGVHHINVGAVSGAWWRGPNKGFPEGLAVFDIDGEDFSWRYTEYGWHARPQQ